jgi:DHA1 family bicyclomycin/chloramphenicol resistance-like MFS transporter
MIATLGATTPNCNATYISHFKQNTGSASALFGANQFFISAIMGGLTTVFYNGTLWPIALILLLSTVVANLMMPRQKSIP